jgi:hypothetical protein
MHRAMQKSAICTALISSALLSFLLYTPRHTNQLLMKRRIGLCRKSEGYALLVFHAVEEMMPLG